jgi:hypothetical protein
MTPSPVPGLPADVSSPDVQAGPARVPDLQAPGLPDAEDVFE